MVSQWGREEQGATVVRVSQVGAPASGLTWWLLEVGVVRGRLEVPTTGVQGRVRLTTSARQALVQQGRASAGVTVLTGVEGVEGEEQGVQAVTPPEASAAPQAVEAGQEAPG
jgi:hypothetical protein